MPNISKLTWLFSFDIDAELLSDDSHVRSFGVSVLHRQEGFDSFRQLIEFVGSVGLERVLVIANGTRQCGHLAQAFLRDDEKESDD